MKVYPVLIFIHGHKAQFEVVIESDKEHLKDGEIGELDWVLEHDFNIFPLNVLPFGHFRDDVNEQDGAEDHLGCDVDEDHGVVDLGAASGFEDAPEFSEKYEQERDQVDGDRNHPQKHEQHCDILKLVLFKEEAECRFEELESKGHLRINKSSLQ